MLHPIHMCVSVCNIIQIILETMHLVCSYILLLCTHTAGVIKDFADNDLRLGHDPVTQLSETEICIYFAICVLGQHCAKKCLIALRCQAIY